MERPNLAKRYELVNTKITLDGKPAMISGARNDFATVRALPNGGAYEFAWSTVALIVANGGAFKS